MATHHEKPNASGVFDDTSEPHRLVVARLLRAGQTPEAIAKATGLAIGRVRQLIQELLKSTG